ncbi:MAG: DinB family protein [Chloroflexi bacterium]|nr:DinB family protein [Chloroflexota bacterium]
MDRSHDARSAAQRARLQALAERLSDEALARSIGGGWTASALLAHVAYWDRMVLARLRRFERREETAFASLDADLINEAALPQWLALPGREAARQAIEAAEAVDRKILELSSEQVDVLLRSGRQRLVDRSEHRRAHLDELERALAG